MKTGFTTLLLILLLVIIVAVVSVLIFSAVAKKKQKKENQPEMPAPENFPPQQNFTDPEKQFVSGAIKIKADAFDGLYEGIFTVAMNVSNGDTSVIDEWKIRVQNMQESEDFKFSFLNSFNVREGNPVLQARFILDCITFAGIERSVETEHVSGLNSGKKYICLSGIVPEGTLCTVVKPYWHMNEKIIEQGCIIKKEG